MSSALTDLRPSGGAVPRLAAAVSEAGGLGFLAAGYKTATGVPGDQRLTSRPFGVNLSPAETPGAATGSAGAADAGPSTPPPST
ncbi:hypothetical protein SVIOM342S_03088 [Streptomyces violaceorubidus]